VPRVWGTVQMQEFDHYQHHDLRLRNDPERVGGTPVLVDVDNLLDQNLGLRKDQQSERVAGIPVLVHVHMRLLHQNLGLRMDQEPEDHHGLRVGHKCPHPEQPDLTIGGVERETAGRVDLMSGERATAGRVDLTIVAVERETAGRVDLMSCVERHAAGQGVSAAAGQRVEQPDFPRGDWSHY